MHKNKVILILGMHRSGTSLMANLVAKFAYMGDDLMGPNEFNTAGYFEYNPLVKLNDEILEYLRASWYFPPDFKRDFITENKLVEKFGNKAYELIGKMNNSGNIWCWKDPRLPFLLNFWKHILEDLEIIYIIPFRHPYNVAKSLFKRNSFPLSVSLLLWERTYLDILYFIKDKKHVYFADYDLFIENPIEQIQLLSDFLNRTVEIKLDNGILNEMYTAIDSTLQNHRIYPESYGQTAFQEQLYSALKQKNITKLHELSSQFKKEHYGDELLNIFFKLQTELIASGKKRKFFAQLFINTGQGYSEKASIVRQVELSEKTIEFDLSNYKNIISLRFDPLNELSVLVVRKIDVVEEDGILIPIPIFKSNAVYNYNGTFIFTTDDPFIELEPKKLKNPQKIIFNIDYLAIGNETYHFLAKDRQKQFLNLTHQINELKKNLDDKIIESKNLMQEIDNRNNIINSKNTLIEEGENRVRNQLGEIDTLKKQVNDFSYKITELETLKTGLERQLHDREIEIQEKNNTIKEYAMEIKTINDLQKILDDKTIESKKLMEEIDNRNAIINSKNKLIEEGENRVRNQLEEIENLKKQLNALKNSRSFRLGRVLTAPARFTYELLKRKNKTEIVPQILENNLSIYEIIKQSELFDTDYYLKNNPDVQKAGIDPVQHYLDFGGFEGRNPSDKFNSSFYLTQYPDVKAEKFNPLLHYVLHGKDEGRKTLNEIMYINEPIVEKAKEKSNAEYQRPNLLDIQKLNVDAVPQGAFLELLCAQVETLNKAKLDIQEIAIQARLFDADYYCAHSLGLVTDPAFAYEHYIERGHLLGLNPSPKFNTVLYCDANRDVYWANLCPLVHFIKHGYHENRILIPKINIDPKYRRYFGNSEYGINGPTLYYDQDVELSKGFGLSIGVHLHLFYFDLAEELLGYLRNIPVTFALFISTPLGEKEQAYVKELVSRKLPFCSGISIVQTENRGRDIAPFLVEFAKQLAEYDLILHFHTKKSLHNDGLADTRRFLLHYVLGNQSIVKQILNIFSWDREIGIVCPPYHPTYRNLPNFGVNESKLRSFLHELGIVCTSEACLDFPAGSFFWCRSNAIAPLLVRSFEWLDFPEEMGQVDGTLAHVIERAFGIVTASCGYKVTMPFIDIQHSLVNYFHKQRPLPPQEVNGPAETLKAKKAASGKNPIAYVTAIFGDYDNLLVPEFVEDDVDYYCFTDSLFLESDLFTIRHVNTYSNNDKRMMARYVKTNLAGLLPEYEYIVWIDANIYFRGKVRSFIEAIVASGKEIGMITHNNRRDCFSEAIECMRLNLDDLSKIEKQMIRYLSLPSTQLKLLKSSKLAETNFMIIKGSSEKVKKFQKIWWQEISSFSKRDQLSVNFALVSSDLDYFSLLKDKMTVRDHPSFAMLAHPQKGQDHSSNLGVEEINYKTYEDLFGLLQKQVVRGTFKGYDLVVGIPRSGMIPATYLGQVLNVPSMSYDEFINETPISKGDRKLNSFFKESRSINVLFIDDSINNGNAYKRFEDKLTQTYMGQAYDWRYIAVYGSEKAKEDTFLSLCKTPRIFQWNYKNHPLAKYFFYDMDGVLCIDPTDKENDDGEKYIDFIKTVQPLYVPKYTIKAIVTSRLEKYRTITEEWLRNNHVNYENLYMLNLASKEERIRLNAHTSFKASIYAKVQDAILFIESNDRQAREIAKMTGKKVICTENDKLY